MKCINFFDLLKLMCEDYFNNRKYDLNLKILQMIDDGTNSVTEQ